MYKVTLYLTTIGLYQQVMDSKIKRNSSKAMSAKKKPTKRKNNCNMYRPAITYSNMMKQQRQQIQVQQHRLSSYHIQSIMTDVYQLICNSLWDLVIESNMSLKIWIKIKKLIVFIASYYWVLPSDVLPSVDGSAGLL